MKRPEYVAAAVTAARAARDGESWDEGALRAVFSRSGFTDGYLTGKRDAGMFGYRTRQDVSDSEGILGSLRELYRRERQSVPVSMRLTVTEAGSSLAVSDGVRTVTAAGPAPERALRRALDEETARGSLSKTGGTQYYVNRFQAELVPEHTLSGAALGTMRRAALGALDAERGAVPPHTRFAGPEREQNPLPPRHREHTPLLARYHRAEQLPADDAPERVILPLAEITPALLEKWGGRLTGELPTVCFPADEAALAARVEELAALGLRELWTENIYGVALARRLGLTARGGFGLNIANSDAARFYAEQGLASLTVSFELPMGAIRALASPVPLGLAVYGRLPLMRYRNCPLRAQIGCAACGGTGTLTDRRGVVFPVECGERRFSSLLNSVPLDIAGRKTPGDLRLLWFTRESRTEAAEILARFRREEKTDAPHTGGLYYRKLL